MILIGILRSYSSCSIYDNRKKSNSFWQRSREMLNNIVSGADCDINRDVAVKRRARLVLHLVT
jgi:hypothetical protein